MADGIQDVQALTRLRRAVKRAGGVAHVARAARLTPGHLANVLCGFSPLARPTMTRLVPHVMLPTRIWLQLLAAPRRKPAEQAQQ